MNHKKLTIEELNYVQNEVKEKGKNIKLAYVLAIFLGFLGVHLAYLGKVKLGVAKFMVFLGALVSGGFILSKVTTNISAESIGNAMDNTLLALVFAGLVVISLIWQVVDLFSISKWNAEIDENNEKIANEKVIQSRYVEEHLLKETITANLIQEITESIKDSVYEELKKKRNLNTI